MSSFLHLNKPYIPTWSHNLQPNLIRTYHLLSETKQATPSACNLMTFKGLCHNGLNSPHILTHDKSRVWWRKNDQLCKSVTDNSIDPHWPLHLITITPSSQYCLFTHWRWKRLTGFTSLFNNHIKLNQICAWLSGRGASESLCVLFLNNKKETPSAAQSHMLSSQWKKKWMTWESFHYHHIKYQWLIA